MQPANPLTRIKARLRSLDRRRWLAEEQEIQASGLFDADWYLEQYLDVRASGGSALRHFTRFGWHERRSPNSLFDTQWYLDAHPDVSSAGLNPLLHYIRHGAGERRDTGPLFRPSLFQDPRTSRGAHHLAAALAYRRGLGLTQNLDISEISATPRVLMIAELSIPQCKKYRVDQKQEMLRDLGVPSSVIDWHDEAGCFRALSTHSLIIFYRVPATPSIMALVKEAKNLGLRTLWEVDDLIFDPNVYMTNSNLGVLEPSLQRSVLSGIPLYRAAMLSTDAAIASTTGLAQAMLEAGVPEVYVVENAIDEETKQIASATTGPLNDGLIRIVYGSGTKTHDKDFLEVSEALLELFGRYPAVRLRIIGELNLPDDFEAYEDRIERFPPSSYEDFLQLLSECDIAIAPLEPGPFNDAKSNIKFIEAAMVGLPSVCSPRAAFAGAITHGRDGFLADRREAWTDALAKLITSASLRLSIAAAAKIEILDRYDPQRVAQNQLSAVLVGSIHPRKGLRVLTANIFYAPRSFGGATVVAEQMARQLNARIDTEVFVFTTAPPSIAKPYEILRYKVSGVPVFAVSLPETADLALDFDTTYTLQAFRDTLALVQPDVVHFHSLQGLGALLLQACKEAGIPMVVTLHDAWWICGRQFMITGEGVYCFQRNIDLNICSSCVTDPGLNAYRQYRLREMIGHADLLLTPSEFFRQLYIENLGAETRIETNKNGVGRPVGYHRSRGEKLRFGFVGGNAALKGADLIRKVFTRLDRSDYELVLIDNMLSLGFASVIRETWPVRGELTVIPAYTQDTMDDFFSRIDVLLFPTQCEESFGLTVREALVRDIWVITTNAGGVVEDIVDGENGAIIPLLDDGSALELAVIDALDRAETLKTHINRFKQGITDYESQSEELHRYLSETAAAGRNRKLAGRTPEVE